MNYYIQRFKVFTSTVFLKVYDGDGILMEVVWRLEKMKSFSSGGLHVPCVAQSTVSTCVRCGGGGFGATEPHEAFLSTPCSCKEGKEDRFPW